MKHVESAQGGSSQITLRTHPDTAAMTVEKVRKSQISLGTEMRKSYISSDSKATIRESKKRPLPTSQELSSKPTSKRKMKPQSMSNKGKSDKANKSRTELLVLEENFFEEVDRDELDKTI